MIRLYRYLARRRDAIVAAFSLACAAAGLALPTLLGAYLDHNPAPASVVYAER